MGPRKAVDRKTDADRCKTLRSQGTPDRDEPGGHGPAPEAYA
ncbi:hypothetical protein ACH4NF_31390 [Streptomyces sp. NPDC017248]